MIANETGPETLPTSGNFVPSGRKRAPPPPTRKGSDQLNTLSKAAKPSNPITKSSEASIKYNSKSINAHEISHFVPRGLQQKGTTDTVTMKRNVKIPGMKPKATRRGGKA